ncbi:MAG: hypothetical protein O2779_03315 [Nanoarchaeota archaeon]|nr:hypothetical protein [Nanoarchaeota archaeon]
MQIQEQLKDFFLFTYTLSSLQQKVKVKALRELQGYKNKKQKVYEHTGLIQQHAAEKIGTNALLVGAKKAIIFTKFFEDYKIHYEYKEVLMKDE